MVCPCVTAKCRAQLHIVTQEPKQMVLSLLVSSKGNRKPSGAESERELCIWFSLLRWEKWQTSFHSCLTGHLLFSNISSLPNLKSLPLWISPLFPLADLMLNSCPFYLKVLKIFSTSEIFPSEPINKCFWKVIHGILFVDLRISLIQKCFFFNEKKNQNRLWDNPPPHVGCLLRLKANNTKISELRSCTLSFISSA